MADSKKNEKKTSANTESGSAHGGRKKKSSGASGKLRIPWAIPFWLAFIIFIFGLFYFNREAILHSVQTIQNEILHRNNPALSLPAEIPDPTEHTITVLPPSSPTVALPPVEQTNSANVTAQPQAPVAEHGTGTTQGTGSSQTTQNAAETRVRPLYFTQVDRGGTILRIRVERYLPVSNSPMTDVIQALIAGPTAEETRRGLITFIPPETRMLSAAVRGNTAFINFNEDFLYNTYGVEGYAGQLRQIVFTVTEFPNVRDVQILIEGQRIDYLGEGIWIGSPLNREMF